MAYTITEESLADLNRYWQDPGFGLCWPSVFVLPDWMDAWWQVFTPSAALRVRVVREGSTVLGIAPLMVREGTACFIGDPSVCDYGDFITVPGRECDLLRLVVGDLKKDGIRRLDLAHLRPDSLALTGLTALADEGSVQLAVSREALSLEIDLPPSWDGYLAGLGGKQRHEVRRKLRRLSERGAVSFSFLPGGSTSSEILDTFFRMFVESREDKASFLTETMRAFFTAVAAAMARNGLLRFGLLALNGRPVAMILCFDYGQGLYLYNSGFDPAYQSVSAGLVCKLLAIKSAIGEGKQMFDFLKGAESYKYHLGGREVPLFRCEVMIQ
jgi:CelD/BcsL family acetyltransferase involved in cellulose biosynthesis